MEETREILITRTFKFKEIIDALTDGAYLLDSFEMSLPDRNGNPEWRRFNVASDKPFIRVKFKEPINDTKDSNTSNNKR